MIRVMRRRKKGGLWRGSMVSEAQGLLSRKKGKGKRKGNGNQETVDGG